LRAGKRTNVTDKIFIGGNGLRRLFLARHADHAFFRVHRVELHKFHHDVAYLPVSLSQGQLGSVQHVLCHAHIQGQGYGDFDSPGGP